MARPSKYNDEIANKICEIISTSNRGIHSICKEDGMPSPSTVFKWISENKEFSDKYTRAKDDQMDFLADEILEIADDDTADDTPFTGINHVHRSKLKIETRKWLMSKLKPKKYGDKLELSGDKENPIQTTLSIKVVKPTDD